MNLERDAAADPGQVRRRDDAGQQQVNRQHTLAASGRTSVVMTKASGARIVFNLYDDRAEAERVAARLREVGCAVHVEPSEVPSPAVQAEAGKCVAMLLYNFGARSLDETKVAFRRHPAWRSA